MLLLASMSLILLPLSTYGAVTIPTRAPLESSSSAQCTVFAGVPGVPGVPGSTGNNGLPGQPGLQGATGPSGEPGEPGASIEGPRGPPGDGGPAGKVGPAGPRSAPGKIGPQGPPGPIGPMGPTGERGLLGLKGKVGPVGPSGDSGVKGQKGDAGQTRHSSFTVAKTTRQQAVSNGNVLTFEEIITNIGEDFNLQEGKFICEIAGVYIFSFAIMVYSQNGMGVSLVKNGDISVGAYGGKHLDQSSATAVLQLQSGDQVWLRVSQSGQTYSTDSKWVSFTGYLLHEL